MTQPQQVPFLDPGNTLLSAVPARLDIGTADTPAGKMGIVTIRTPSATMTVFLNASDLRDWAGLLTALADKTGSSLTPASPLDMAALRAHDACGTVKPRSR